MFMKQLKFLMVAFTLLMGVSLTSCLSDDAGESMYDGIGYVRTIMGTYFIDPNGNTYYPTSSSVVEMEAQGFKMSEADLAYIAFKYVEDTPTTKADANTTPKTFRIKLVSAAAVDSYQTEEAASIEDMETMVPENAPIVTLEPTDNYGQTYKPWMYGTEMLVLPVFAAFATSLMVARVGLIIADFPEFSENTLAGKSDEASNLPGGAALTGPTCRT